MPADPWPFDDPKNTACFTVAEVLSGAKPILYVSHDVDDGAWQFLSGAGPAAKRAKVVSLADMLEIEPGLRELSDLPLGWTAERERAGKPWRRTSRFPTEWPVLLEAAYAYTDEQQERLKAEFDLPKWERFEYDQEKATLVLSHGGVPRVAARIQIVGSVSQKRGTWLWAWDNPSIREAASLGLERVRKFGEQHGFQRLSAASFRAEEADGWEMASVACLLLGGEGVYRTPRKGGALFMVLSELRRLDDGAPEDAA